MDVDSDSIERLTRLGLNRLEAEVYTLLLANRPMTGYRLAKLLGKATANVYKAVDTLASRGAVLVEEGENRLCRAVPAPEFLRHLEQQFREETHQAERALSQLRPEAQDERVYRMESVAHVKERCRQMLAERAERVAVVDAFPRALRAILPAVEAAVARGITVYVQTYDPVRIEGAQVVDVELGGQVEAFWGSQQLNVVVDGRECLLALVDHGLSEVYQGLWSNSLYLSCLVHAGMLSEHTLHRLRAVEGDDGTRLRAVLDEHRFFLNSDVPGQRELLSRFVETGLRKG